MSYGMFAQCPCCSTQATTTSKQDGIEKTFGWRTPTSPQPKKTIPQSYCRKCRTSHCSPGNPRH